MKFYTVFRSTTSLCKKLIYQILDAKISVGSFLNIVLFDTLFKEKWRK